MGPDRKNQQFDPELMAEFKALKVQANAAEPVQDRVAVETPFEVRINGRSHTMLMINPSAVSELAVGFALSEGLVAGVSQVEGVEVGWADLPGLGKAWYADLTLPADLARAAKVRRVAPAATSCGLCGLESFSQLGRDVRPVEPGRLQVEAEALLGLVDKMVGIQRVFVVTGGTHAALVCAADGEVIAAGEDVGRHNALDKALGAALMKGADLGRCLAFISGRISYEMAIKAARCGLQLLGSVSAATALGVRLLDRLGITLVAFTRPPRFTVFTHPRRVLVKGEPLAGLPPIENLL